VERAPTVADVSAPTSALPSNVANATATASDVKPFVLDLTCTEVHLSDTSGVVTTVTLDVDDSLQSVDAAARHATDSASKVSGNVRQIDVACCSAASRAESPLPRRFDRTATDANATTFGAINGDSGTVVSNSNPEASTTWGCGKPLDAQAAAFPRLAQTRAPRGKRERSSDDSKRTRAATSAGELKGSEWCGMEPCGPLMKDSPVAASSRRPAATPVALGNA
jgi:hypothetical protein